MCVFNKSCDIKRMFDITTFFMFNDLHAIYIFYSLLLMCLFVYFFQKHKDNYLDLLLYVNNCDIYNELHNHFRE